MKELYIKWQEAYIEDVCDALGEDFCDLHNEFVFSYEFELLCQECFCEDREVEEAAEIILETFRLIQL